MFEMRWVVYETNLPVLEYRTRRQLSSRHSTWSPWLIVPSVTSDMAKKLSDGDSVEPEASWTYEHWDKIKPSPPVGTPKFPCTNVEATRYRSVPMANKNPDMVRVQLSMKKNDWVKLQKHLSHDGILDIS